MFEGETKELPLDFSGFSTISLKKAEFLEKSSILNLLKFTILNVIRLFDNSFYFIFIHSAKYNHT